MQKIKHIAVFCSTSLGDKPEFAEAARQTGLALARRKITLVYGGGKDGMAGHLVKAALEGGGKVIGVMPRFLAERGRAFEGLEEFHIAEDLRHHKAIMAELGDGFIGLPGGLGTLEEFFEALTWAQLGLHRKPCGLVNTAGYFDKLLDFMDSVRDGQFITPETRELLISAPDADTLIAKFLEEQEK